MLRRRSSRRRTEAGLLVVGAVVVLFATMLESLALTGALPDHVVEFIVILALIAIGVQVVNRIYAAERRPGDHAGRLVAERDGLRLHRAR